jgi:hypothetical protein
MTISESFHPKYANIVHFKVKKKSLPADKTLPPEAGNQYHITGFFQLLLQ